MSDEGGGALTGLGKLISFLLIVGLVGTGAYMLLKPQPAVGPSTVQPGVTNGMSNGPSGPVSASTTEVLEFKDLAETKFEVPKFSPPLPYVMKDNCIDIELSEYVGYAGLIVANGGLAPNENSVFFKKHGVKVRLRLSESDDWTTFGNGERAASATTADVLAVYGRQFPAVVPLQIGFSRGADGIVVRGDIKRINQLKGRVVATRQFTEVDFFVRFLAQEAGLDVHMLPDLKAPLDPEKVNLIFCEEAEQAVDLFLADLQSGGSLIAGCAAWAPFTTEAVEKSGGKARLLIDNRNLLIVADVLVVHKQFAEQNPKLVAALVDGILEGNKMVRENPNAHLDVIAKAFNTQHADKPAWDKGKVLKELAKVHLSNLPENLAFFKGDIDAAGSFGGIYQSALMAYGSQLVKNPSAAEKFFDLQHLEALKTAGSFAEQKILIQPIKTQSGEALEKDPVLSKDIRFFFEPNSSRLDLTGKDRQENEANLAAIKKLLQISPGSTVLLRGHVDDTMKQKFVEMGGQDLLRKKTLESVQLSKDRAEEIRKHLIAQHALEIKRLDVYGAGWNEPVNKSKSELNRRVEVQWFTLE